MRVVARSVDADIEYHIHKHLILSHVGFPNYADFAALPVNDGDSEHSLRRNSLGFLSRVTFLLGLHLLFRFVLSSFGQIFWTK